jgi:hypothetical protein
MSEWTASLERPAISNSTRSAVMSVVGVAPKQRATRKSQRLLSFGTSRRTVAYSALQDMQRAYLVIWVQLGELRIIRTLSSCQLSINPLDRPPCDNNLHNARQQAKAKARRSWDRRQQSQTHRIVLSGQRHPRAVQSQLTSIFSRLERHFLHSRKQKILASSYPFGSRM